MDMKRCNEDQQKSLAEISEIINDIYDTIQAKSKLISSMEQSTIPAIVNETDAIAGKAVYVRREIECLIGKNDDGREMLERILVICKNGLGQKFSDFSTAANDLKQTIQES
jgi:predicted transcriptional regulator